MHTESQSEIGGECQSVQWFRVNRANRVRDSGKRRLTRSPATVHPWRHSLGEHGVELNAWTSSRSTTNTTTSYGDCRRLVDQLPRHCPVPLYGETLDTALPRDTASPREAMPTAVSGIVIWLIPDLALTFALVTLVSIFFLFHGATTLFGDTDTGWHIRNGERIIRTGFLPHVDPYSFSKIGPALGSVGVGCGRADGRGLPSCGAWRYCPDVWSVYCHLRVDVVPPEPRGGGNLVIRMPAVRAHALDNRFALAREATSL